MLNKAFNNTRNIKEKYLGGFLKDNHFTKVLGMPITYQVLSAPQCLNLFKI